MLVVHHLITLTICYSLFACSKSNDGKDGSDFKRENLLSRLVLNEPNDKKLIEWDSLIEEIEIIPLETTESNLISNIQKVICMEEFMYVFDRSQEKIFIYREDGKLFNSIEHGQGPNDPREINDFTFDAEGNLWILSYQVLEKFSKDGSRVGIYTLDLDDELIEYINPFYISYSSNSFFLWGGSVGHKRNDLAKNPTFAMINVIEVEGKFVIRSRYFPVHRGLLECLRFSQNKDSVVLTTFLESDTIFFAYGNTVIPKYLVDFGESSYSNYSELMNYELNESQVRLDIMQNTKLCGEIMNPVLTSNHISFKYTGKNWSFQAICDRKTLHTKTGSVYYYEGQIPFTITSALNDRFIAYSESQLVEKYVKTQLDTTALPIVIRKNWKKLSRVTAFDNPLIMVIKLKSF